MNGMLFLATAVLSVALGGEAKLSLVQGAPRAFGSQKVIRTFRIEGEGVYTVEWRTRIFRGIVERGKRQVTAPGIFEIEMNLPEVRARVDLVHDIQLRREGGVVTAGGAPPLTLFPSTILTDFAAAEAPLPPMGLYDPEEVIAPILEEAEVKFVMLRTNLQVNSLESKLVLVASNQAMRRGEPMEAIRELPEKGGTVVLLEQSNLPGDFFGEEAVARTLGTQPHSAADVLVGRDHIVLRDIYKGDLSTWSGTERVASSPLAWPEWERFRPLFLTAGDGERAPVLAEYWGSNGRAFFCQMEIARHLNDEPAAQLLLRNLIAYARESALPATPIALRLAVPAEAIHAGRFVPNKFIREPSDEDMEQAVALLILLGSGASDGRDANSLDLSGLLKDGGDIIVQSAFEDDVIEAVNHLLHATWRDDPHAPLPMLSAAELPGEWSSEVDYSNRLAWGILPEDIVASIADMESPHYVTPNAEAFGWRVLATPGVLAKYEREGARLVFCAFPPSDAEHPQRKRIVAQLIANSTLGQEERAKKK